MKQIPSFVQSNVLYLGTSLKVTAIDHMKTSFGGGGEGGGEGNTLKNLGLGFLIGVLSLFLYSHVNASNIGFGYQMN